MARKEDVDFIVKSTRIQPSTGLSHTAESNTNVQNGSNAAIRTEGRQEIFDNEYWNFVKNWVARGDIDKGLFSDSVRYPLDPCKPALDRNTKNVPPGNERK